MPITFYYVDPAINANSGAGTIGDPFGDLQYALNTIVRNATSGDQVNIKAGAAEVLAAPLTLATYGTPTDSAPLILRGYTAAAGDGGIGVINGNGNNIWAAAYSYLNLFDLRACNGDAAGYIATLGSFSQAINARFDANTAHGLRLGGYSVMDRCYLANIGLWGIVTADAHCTIRNSVFVNGANQFATAIVAAGHGQVVEGCLFSLGGASNGIAGAWYGSTFTHNVLWGNGGSGQGIAPSQQSLVTNNLIAGFSGVGGIGLYAPAIWSSIVHGHNAYYNNATHKSVLGNVLMDLSSNDVILAADPSVDAAGGDFRLTPAAQALLVAAGWPASYLGLGAAVDPQIAIGALQYGSTATGGGGAVSISPWRGNIG